MSYAKRQRSKAKGVLAGMSFIPVLTELLRSANYASLSPSATKLLMALMAQLQPVKGNPAPNNGDLSVAVTVLKPFGFRSQHTITRAKNELQAKGWIEPTKMGGLGMGPILYALTFWPIGECGGKLDVLPTTRPSHAWRQYVVQPRAKSKAARQKVHQVTPTTANDDAENASRFTKVA